MKDKKEKKEKSKFNLAFDNLAIPEVHIGGTVHGQGNVEHKHPDADGETVSLAEGETAGPTQPASCSPQNIHAAILNSLEYFLFMRSPFKGEETFAQIAHKRTAPF